MTLCLSPLKLQKILRKAKIDHFNSLMKRKLPKQLFKVVKDLCKSIKESPLPNHESKEIRILANIFLKKQTKLEVILVPLMALINMMLDPIPTLLLIECTSELIPFITKIVNLSIESGEIPDAFKILLSHLSSKRTFWILSTKTITLSQDYPSYQK